MTLSQKIIGNKTKRPSIQPERCHGSEVEELYFGCMFCFKINSSMARLAKKHGKRCVIVHTLVFLKRHVLRVYCLNICWFWGKACIKACHDLNDWTLCEILWLDVVKTQPLRHGQTRPWKHVCFENVPTVDMSIGKKIVTTTREAVVEVWWFFVKVAQLVAKANRSD